ncbi:DegT/DnrJ/EryC1/StrS aminotransferase family protein [Brachybacterium sp. GPGPB12]|uniref:DegT/DnrJ/EryC1/StrS family aminotransferase n=1 Tax=Brachybacterium sp. GPGPB12 TaxID=3023517 RepID=UPI0031345968
MVPFAAPYLEREEQQAVLSVVEGGWIGTGDVARDTESRFATYLKVPHALLLSSGTVALHLALLGLGVGTGDEVVVPTITFTATATTVVHAGARPVLVDVEPDTLNIDLESARRALTPRTKALVLVHMAGRMADVRAARRFCDEHGLRLIEDSAHALPAERDGITPGALSDAAAFSFFATKPLTSAEGGLLVTPHADVEQRCRVLSGHGIDRSAHDRHRFGRSPHYDVIAAGFKYNLPDILAAVLRCQLARADALHARRARIARIYLEELDGVPGLDLPPADTRTNRSSWYLFIVRVPAHLKRDELATRLAADGVGTSVHLRPLHQFSYYADHYPTDPAHVRVADEVYPRLLSLPIFPAMTDEQVAHVASTVRRHAMARS